MERGFNYCERVLKHCRIELTVDNRAEPQAEVTVGSAAHVMARQSKLKLHEGNRPVVVSINSLEKFLNDKKIKNYLNTVKSFC